MIRDSRWEIKVVNLYILIALTLFVVDLATNGEMLSVSFLKAVGYSTKTFIGILIFGVGLKLLLIKPFPIQLKVALFAYLLMLSAWLLTWFANWNGKELFTLIVNPSFSFFTWSLIFIIPIFAQPYGAQVFLSLKRIRLVIPLFIIGIAYVVWASFGIHLFMPTAGVFLIFIVSCHSPKNYKDIYFSAIALLSLSLIMISTGYRIYALASLVLLVLILGQKFTQKTLIKPFVLILFAIPFIYHFGVLYYLEYLTLIDADLFVDTRTFLFIEIFNDLSIREMLFGKGLLGTYFSEYFYNTVNQYGGDHFIRSGSEIGWLNLVLKFGLLGLILHLFLILYPLLKYSMSTKNERTLFNDQLATFSLVMLFVFVAELPAAINFGYFIWYAVTGVLWRIVNISTNDAGG